MNVIVIMNYDKPWWFQEAEAPRFQYNRRKKTVRLSDLLLTEYFWYSFLLEAECGRNDSDAIGVRTPTFRLLAQCMN